MAKKGGQTALQQEVNNDEEWEALLEKEGLIVVDVYSEWCGPCLGMVGNLKKLKLEIGGDNLHLAIAKSDNITTLERFRKKSEPTWMFISGGKMLRIIFGAHAPKLMRAIEQELKNELKAQAGDFERKLYEFHELTEEELARQKQLMAKLEHEKEKVEREHALKLDQIKRRTLERMARELVHYNFVLFFPHIIKEPDEHIKKRTSQAAYKLMVQYDYIRLTPIDQMDVLLRKEDLAEMFYDSDMLDHLPKSFIKMITKNQCMVTLLMSSEYKKPSEEEEVLLYSPSELMGVIEEKLANVVYGHMDPHNPKPATVGHMFLQENEEGVVIPPLWAPLSFISKTAAMKVLFPSLIESLNVREDTLPPPSYVMIFDANKAHEILEAAEPYIEDILHIGYFDGTDPETARKVAKTVYQLERMGPAKVLDSKMVMALTKTRSDPMLALAQHGPVYISHDLTSGTKECDMFFPPQVVIEEEPDHWAQPAALEITEEGVYLDDFGNQYTMEYWEDEETGESVLVKRLYKYPDGSSVHGFYELTQEGEYILKQPEDFEATDVKFAEGEEEIPEAPAAAPSEEAVVFNLENMEEKQEEEASVQEVSSPPAEPASS